MYCQLHRPITSGSQLACFLGHVGDSIYWFQKGVGLPDALGFVPPPYFPLLHIGLTGLVCVLLLKALLLDPFSALTKLTLTRRRGRSGCSGHSTFVRVYLRNAVLVVFELFTLSSIVNITLMLAFRNADHSSTAYTHPEMYSPVMRTKLQQYGVIF